MDDRKLRIAFAKIKKDMISIKEDLYDLAKEQANGIGAQNPATSQNQLKFDNFVSNVENELKALTLFTKELEDRVSHIQNSQSVSMPSQTNQANKSLEDKQEQLEGKLADFSELVNEKIDLEINSLRLEFTEEIAKVYDRVFTEVLEIKDEMGKKEIEDSKSSKKVSKKSSKKKVKNSTKKEEEKETQELYQPISERKEKPGKLKKVMNWLFVEEEDDLKDVKSEVKKDKDKDELY